MSQWPLVLAADHHCPKLGQNALFGEEKNDHHCPKLWQNALFGEEKNDQNCYFARTETFLFSGGNLSFLHSWHSYSSYRMINFNYCIQSQYKPEKARKIYIYKKFLVKTDESTFFC